MESRQQADSVIRALLTTAIAEGYSLRTVLDLVLTDLSLSGQFDKDAIWDSFVEQSAQIGIHPALKSMTTPISLPNTPMQTSAMGSLSGSYLSPSMTRMQTPGAALNQFSPGAGLFMTPPRQSGQSPLLGSIGGTPMPSPSGFAASPNSGNGLLSLPTLNQTTGLSPRTSLRVSPSSAGSSLSGSRQMSPSSLPQLMSPRLNASGQNHLNGNSGLNHFG